MARKSRDQFRGVAVEGRVAAHPHSRFSACARSISSEVFEKRPHTKFLPTVGIQTAHVERSTKRHMWCPHLQLTQVCKYSYHMDLQFFFLGFIYQVVACTEHVMTYRHSRPSRLMRETYSRLMRPRKDHSLNFSDIGRTNGHQEADNVRQRYYANGTLIDILCRPTGAVVHQPYERSLAGFRTNAFVKALTALVKSVLGSNGNSCVATCHKHTSRHSLTKTS